MKTARRSRTLKGLEKLRWLWTNRQAEARSAKRRQYFFEPLESRSLLASDLGTLLDAEGEGSNTNPTFAVIANQTVLNGSPLWLGIDGSDAESNPLTYTVTSSNPSVVAVTVPTGNKSLQLNVTGFGTMKFQLFDNLVPRVTQAIEDLAQAGFYNGLTFHRVINNFVIQGGAADGQGGPNANVPDFNDQFNFDLQHNSAGLLSMAKSLDDTNDTQFFITDTTASFPRHLDFNHSIFGKLTEGESVREAISNVSVGVGDVPNTPVVISSASIITDTENGAFMLKALGNSGTSVITVTANDGMGGTFSRTFNVTVAADTVNGNPFLSDIPPVNAAIGTSPITLQLTGNDIEGDAIYYDAVKIGSVNYTISSVDHTTGAVTIIPPAGFIGNFQVQVSAKALAQQGTADSGQSITDVQKVTINVNPLAPTSVDLLAASDTGTSSTDNITNASSLQIQVSGVTSGATVRLYEGTNMLAQGTASGNSATLTFANIAALGEGVHNFTATQVVTGQESAKSAPISITYDVTAPSAFTSTPPTEGSVGIAYNYNAQNPGEGQAGFAYSLTTPPAGATIDAATGVIAWTPLFAQVGNLTFGIVASDAAGNTVTQTANVAVAQPVIPLIDLALQITTADGTQLSTLHVGDNFFLTALVQDLNVDAEGVYAMFTDITFNSAKAMVTGAIQYNAGPYTVGTTGNTSTPGLIDEAGAVSNSLQALGDTQRVLFRVPMKVTGSGQLTFTADPADILPSHDALIYGIDPPIESGQIIYGSVSIGVDTTFNAINDVFNFNEDTSNNTLSVLTNDTIVPGSGNVLTITSVGATNHLGSVSIVGGTTLRYTPVGNFVGSETFSYTISNQFGETATANVTVQVAPVNDPPTATADDFTVGEDVANTIFDVLQNDSISPDSGETLSVSAVTQGNHGGSVQIGPNGASVRYTPPSNFSGTETFTYTANDGHGGTAQATVTMTITPTNDNPVANADSATVAEESAATNIQVLANDNSGPDASETLSITAVGTPDKGGTVTIGTNGNVVYTPATNFQGIEAFSYTISDGNGGSSSGIVTVTVTNTNDPPTAVTDTLTGFKNTANLFAVLANDTSAPDPAEVFTITTVTQPAHGTVTITNNGTRVTYTPTTDYTGADTFTYTMQDPGGLSSTGTVNVTVQDFIPSSLAGKVFLDGNGNGQQDSGESGIGGVQLNLAGIVNGTQPVALSFLTNIDGSYKFENLAPGTYVIHQVQPAFLVDGPDSPGSQGGRLSANDEITIVLAQNTNGTANNFGEMGKPRQLTRIEEFFATNIRQNVLFAAQLVPPAGGSPTTFATPVSPTWQNTMGDSWSQFHDFKFALSGDSKNLQVNVTNSQSQQFRSVVPVADASRILDLDPNRLGNQRLLRLIGDPALFNFQPISSSSSSEGEGESDEGNSFFSAATIHDIADDFLGATSDEQYQAAIDAALTEEVDWTLA